MADVVREGNEIVLKLSIGERIMAMHGDIRVPLSAVKSWSSPSMAPSTPA